MRLAPGCVGYDAEWQFPAITERHAYNQAARLLPASESVVYLAFPWATLIDRLHTVGQKAATPLLARLDEITHEVSGFDTVVTVCQHIKGLEYADLMARAGVTDLFWSHATKDGPGPDLPFDVRPFPLYPVQQAGEINLDAGPDREYLFSFIGARANQGYLTQSRNWILDLLRDHPRALIRGRDIWHYNRVVYDHQIRGTAQDATTLIDETASDEFRRSMAQSVFSLCPSGTGPNSIRLWESIGFGAIPVILADTYQPPGNAALWDDAVVFCEETERGIRVLPDRLQAIERDAAQMARKRSALRQLWMIYGPECFIYDLQRLVLARHCQARQRLSERLVLPMESLHALAARVLAQQPGAAAVREFTLACASRVMLNPGALRLALALYPRIREALERLLREDWMFVDLSVLKEALARHGIDMGTESSVQ